MPFQLVVALLVQHAGTGDAVPSNSSGNLPRSKSRYMYAGLQHARRRMLDRK